MLKCCSPTLLALALGFAPLFGHLHAAVAPGEAERDEHARAIRSLIDLGAKLPAKRQIEAWAKAGYTDTTPSLKQALETVYGVAFDSKPEPKADPAAPKIVQEILGNQGGVQQIVKLLNESRRILDPDAPKPLVPPTEEKTAAIKRTFAKLNGSFAKDFKVAYEAVKAHKAAEDKLWELDERKDAAKIREINHTAVLLRIEALKSFYFAHMALREAATRGADFGLDPAPINAGLAAFCKEYKEAISEWEFAWADQHPQLLLYCAIATAEGVRQKVLGYGAAEAEASLLKVCDLEVEQFPAGVRDGVRTLQATAWGNLLRWQLEQGNDASYARGLANFNDFRGRTKDGREFALSNDKLDAERAAAIGQIYILAGRIHRAKGDNATATSLFAQVRGSRNPLSFQAGQWFAPADSKGGGENAWAKDPLPSDPGSALTIGRALIAEAENANPKQQREYYLNAAVGLRDGVLGLTTRTFADQFVDSGAPVYRNYARSLARLGMAYHAAAAAQEGVRQVSLRMGDKAALARWKEKDGKTWTKSGEQVKNLVSDALAYGSSLYAKARTPASKRLYDDTIEFAKLVDPEMVGPGLEWQLVLGLYNDGDYAGCIETGKAFAKKYPEGFLKAAGLIIRARQAWIEKLDDSKAPADQAKLAEVSKENEDGIGKLEKYVQDELKKPNLTPERKKELQSSLVTISSAQVRAKVKAKKYEEVITKDLSHQFWLKPPTDMDLRATMLRFLAQAVSEYHLALSGIVDPKVDKAKPIEPDKLVAAWAMYAVAMADVSKQMKAFGNDLTPLKSAPERLAQVAQIVSAQADQLVRQKTGGPEVAKVLDEAKRYFADFAAVKLTEKSRPALILAVAQTLWDINEKARAVRLFEIYKVRIDEDDLVKGYRSDPGATLAPFATTLTARQEFRKGWDEVVDLLTDPAGYNQDLITHGTDGVQGKGEQRNFSKAMTKIDALKALITSAGYLDADGKKKMIEACDQLRGLASNLAYGISIDTNLAQYYRESGEAGKAVELYRRLYNDYDPLNPAYSTGLIEGVLQALRSDRASVTDDQIKTARVVAGKNLLIFERQPGERDNFWLSWLQVLELSKALGAVEAKAIKKQLEYTVISRTTPRDDLIDPIRKGDDPRVRRARNQSAVDIATRYLALFDGTGVELPFRTDTVTSDGNDVAIFVDRGAPVMQVTAAEIDGEDTSIITAVGEAAPPAAEAAPAPTPAPAPAPAGGGQ